MECPRCKLINPDVAVICDCGYNFSTGLHTPGPQGEEKKSRPVAGVLFMLGSLLSILSGGQDPGHPAPAEVVVLIAGIVGAGLAFAGAARKTRISSAALALVGTLLIAAFARGHWMPGGLPLFDIGAVLTLLFGLCLEGARPGTEGANEHGQHPRGAPGHTTAFPQDLPDRTRRPVTAAVQADTSFYGHPRGLATLFFTEMWERYSYYGTRALLILFMVAPAATGGLAFPVVKAGAIYSVYAAMVYLLCLAGGWIADRITGQRRAVLYGGMLIAAGNFCLATPSVMFFYAGLGLIMMGTGMLKPNVSVIVGQIYAPGDHRRDSGFSIFYMGINLGALISPLICGWVGENVSWRLGFAISGVGMVAGLIQYWFGGKYLGQAGLHPSSTGDPAKDRGQKRIGAIAAALVVAVLGTLGILGSMGVIAIDATIISNGLGWVLVVISAGAFYWMIFGKGWSVDERKRAVAILVLFIASAIFWASFEQAGSSLNLFAERNTNRMAFGHQFPASWFQSVQPLFVIALAPVFAWLWLALGRREPSSPAKFTLGLILVGLSFAIMVPPARGGLVSPWWLVGCYLLATFGELCLSPIGLSAMTKLAPARIGGFVMGIWFLGTAVGNWLAGRAGGLFESMPLPQLFGAVAASALVAGLVLAVLIKPTVRMMSGVK